MKDWRDQLRELGFGNQAVIVGTKRRELFDEIEKMFVERQKILELLDEMSKHDWGDLMDYESHEVGVPKGYKRAIAELRQQIKEMK